VPANRARGALMACRRAGRARVRTGRKSWHRV
jgi:hypothetical protein